LIALALQFSAGYVTTKDKHILSQKKNLEVKYPKLKIINKKEFLQLFT
jgi:predicted nucleic acid-binding protein